MNTAEIALAAEAEDLARLRTYLVHFVDHLAAHVDDVARRRAGLVEPPALARLLDEAIADIETSRRSMVRVVSLLTTTVGADAPAVDHHEDHHHHGSRHDHRHG